MTNRKTWEYVREQNIWHFNLYIGFGIDLCPRSMEYTEQSRHCVICSVMNTFHFRFMFIQYLSIAPDIVCKDVAPGNITYVNNYFGNRSNFITSRLLL